MVTDSEKKAIIKEDRKRIKQHARDYAKVNEKIITRFNNKLADGMSYEEAMDHVCEVFEVGTRRVKNQLAKFSGALNPETKTINEAKFIGYMNAVEQRIDDQVIELDVQIDELDRLESEGQDYYELEVIETISEKENKVVTKKVPIAEARNILLRRAVDALKSYGETVGKLRGNQTLVNINNTSAIDQLNDEDLDRQIDAEESRTRKNTHIKSDGV